VATVGAGCIGSGELDDYALLADELELSSIEPPHLWPDPTAVRATTRVDITSETKERYLSKLFDTGSVTVQQWPLVRRVRWGTETQPRPTFLRRDGTYYEVTLASERILERERWHIAVERTDEPPSTDATVVSPPFNLSTQDERILEAALDAVYAGNGGFLGEPEFDEPQTVEYHQGLDPEASELVPVPPFDFVKVQDQYFRPLVEQQTAEVPEWTYRLKEITSTRSEFNSYARDVIVQHELRAETLSTAARDVINDAISEEPRRYEEGAPPSDGLAAVLDALGIAGDFQPIDTYKERVDFRDVAAAYQGSVYQFSLIVNP
jgi:hypothetical protein